MEEKSSFTIHIPQEKQILLDALAAVIDRSRNYVVNEAITDYLAYHAWKLDAVQTGLDAADRGDVVSQSDVFQTLRDRYTT